ncbi:sulfur carrier protein ThiS [Candidatus Woesearchaeota archaeon]|nr:sulfur carrier protein ThiS [Candidatus Woesearchaeota archaeon]
MEILLNGKLYSLTSEKKLVDLFKKLNFSSGAVAVNNAIIHKEDFEKIVLHNNDKVDIVEVVGGG